MTLREEVQNAASPMEALLLLADAVDAVSRAQLDAEPDPWAGWNEKEAAPVTIGDDVAVDEEDWLEPGKREEIELLVAAKERALAGNEDALESRVLRAELFLLKDQLAAPPDNVDLEQKRTIQVPDATGDVMVEVPEADAETQELRDVFAREHLADPLEEEYGEEDAEKFIQSYIVAGPLLFYYSDRDFVDRLPNALKVAMVEDVEKFSPAEAHEMARDLLKNWDPESSNTLDIVIENTPHGETG